MKRQPFCCEVVANTPEIIGYYAANLNSDIPTVKSANPNARLFAFKNGLLGQYHVQVLVTSLDVNRYPITPPKGIT